MGITDWRAFIQDNTVLKSPPLTPEIPLYLASDDLPLWQMGEAELERIGLPAPFWAFAWAGGQAMARYVMDNPQLVAGKRVLDFGAGSALAGIAAKKAGAAYVLASEIDPVCDPAIALNAEANQVDIAVTLDDLTQGPLTDIDIILAADVCYEGPSSRAIVAWLEDHVARGVTVLVGDPGRTYFPQDKFQQLARYAVPTDSRVEDTDLRNARVWKFR